MLALHKFTLLLLSQHFVHFSRSHLSRCNYDFSIFVYWHSYESGSSSNLLYLSTCQVHEGNINGVLCEYVLLYVNALCKYAIENANNSLILHDNHKCICMLFPVSVQISLLRYAPTPPSGVYDGAISAMHSSRRNGDGVRCQPVQEL